MEHPNISSSSDSVDGAAPGRVAVVAIHGVGDQQRGHTARVVASLLVNLKSAPGLYGQGPCDTVLMAAPPLQPMRPVVPASPGRPVGKALKQSLLSDFQRSDWTAATDERAPGPESASEKPVTPAVPPPPDLGIAFTDYLLFKAVRNGARSESYEATHIALTRQDGAGPQRVDVFEMYWADLSQLSGQVPRIIAELFTMLFRFSILGRDTVDKTAHNLQVASSPRARWWTRLAWWQRMLDGAFSLVLSNLVLQLLLAGLLIAGLGNIVPYTDLAAAVVKWGGVTLGLGWYLYRYAGNAGSRLLGCAVAAAALWGLGQAPGHLLVGLGWLTILGLLCDYGLRLAEERAPAVRVVGLACLAGTAIGMIAQVAVGMSAPAGPADLHLWVVAAIRMVEIILCPILAWWLIIPFALLIWLAVGQLAAGAGGASRTSVATGRLGLFVSLSFFVVIWMALWALLTAVVESGAAGLRYTPLIFTESTPQVAADAFLHRRYENSTESFIVVAGLAVCMLAYMLVMMLPSVLAELKAAVGTAGDLGRWLSGGYRYLDRFVATLVLAGALAACVVGVLMILTRLGIPFPLRLEALSDTMSSISRETLKPLVLSAAGIVTMLSVFGGYLSRYVPWLRMPLNVALDVDNYFREFPRKAIPRARIFSRYVALLENIMARDYDRIVIVAHSQGTVITAELLRYMRYRARREDDRTARLWRRLEGKVDVVTAGCPLRQLYAARFPDSYAWICPDEAAAQGPLASDIGANRWINLYTTGDYVGRWLWPGSAEHLYAVYSGAGLPDGRRHDICLGRGAHTHYFDPGQTEVATCIDALIGAHRRAVAP